MADFRPGDTLITLSYGSNLLAKGIQFYQRDLLCHPDPAWRSTHAETVLAVNDTKVITGSQTFPIAKYNTYDKAYLQVHLLGDRPKYALFRFRDYSNVVTKTFAMAMAQWWRIKTGEGKPFYKRWWGGFYDVGQLLMYPINWVRHKFGAEGVVAWLEKNRAGLTADGKEEDYIFRGISSSRVAPSHFWMETHLMKIL